MQAHALKSTSAALCANELSKARARVAARGPAVAACPFFGAARCLRAIARRALTRCRERPQRCTELERSAQVPDSQAMWASQARALPPATPAFALTHKRSLHTHTSARCFCGVHSLRTHRAWRARGPIRHAWRAAARAPRRAVRTTRARADRCRAPRPRYCVYLLSPPRAHARFGQTGGGAGRGRCAP
jgi:hypothetical protein